ncbi:MAG: bifunctional molybdenum cofactor biosynthesis protein MoaC/MoaB [Gammaproteobacteria bacterium]
MKNITSKPETLRAARAGGTVQMPAECVALLRERRTEKGDALEIARAAAILGAKRTWELLPLCHQLPLASVRVDYRLEDKGRVHIEAEVEVIAATGVEMEALTAVAVAALTLYDMLKPHAGTALQIGDIRLLEKRGGKSQYQRKAQRRLSAAVIVLSDTVAAGGATDQAGLAVKERLAQADIKVTGYEVLPDEPAQLSARLAHWLAQRVDILLTVGGTGVGPRDRTVETVEPLIEVPLAGIVETARAYGQRRMPYAMLSRAVAGLAGGTLLFTLPGSTRGALESLEATLPGLMHVFEALGGSRHGRDTHGHP